MFFKKKEKEKIDLNEIFNKKEEKEREIRKYKQCLDKERDRLSKIAKKIIGERNFYTINLKPNEIHILLRKGLDNYYIIDYKTLQQLIMEFSATNLTIIKDYYSFRVVLEGIK